MAKTVVLGLGVSGSSACEFLLSQGKEVIGVDRNRAAADRLIKRGIQFCEEGDSLDFACVDQVVVSPGISPSHPFYAGALARGVPVVGEAQLALPFLKKPLVAVTGTNGKTTVTLLAEHVLNTAGIKARSLGNVGMALCSYLLNPGDEEAFVVELSSYQLETMTTPVFDAGLILNVTPDHLDRYKTLEDYARAKCRLQALVKTKEHFFVQDKVCAEYPGLLSSARAFGVGSGSNCPIWTDGSSIVEGDKVVCILPLRYRGDARHLIENRLAAWLLCRPFGIRQEQFIEALETFKIPPHRIEWVAELGGVSYYDDSKGTNVDAVIQAVSSMPGPVVLIAGGVDKGSSYHVWLEPFKDRVKHIITLGQAAPKMVQELAPFFSVTHVESLEAAVERAAQIATKGDCVLLSPGCSSFDMFRDYAHRGETFQMYVRRRL
jgi:UDP-N-acetylmuramoylalanine--D-glutamate ligase